MPLTPEEAAALSPQALELGRAIGDACSPDSDGGKRVTRAERQELLRLATQLAARLALDLVD